MSAKEPTQPALTLENIITLWSQALEAETVHPDDNFFELGGDSLRAKRLVWLAEEQLGIHLDLAALYEFPTPTAFMEYVEQELSF